MSTPEIPNEVPTFDGAAAAAPEAPATPTAPQPAAKNNFELTGEYRAVADFEPGAETAFMPSATISRTRDVLSKMPDVDFTNDPKSQDWMGSLNGGLSSMPYQDGLAGAAAREDGFFLQAIKGPTGDLAGFAPRFKAKEGVKPQGESARFAIRAAMGMGTVFAVPLWHSGFWMTMKAPSESELLELHRQITADKISLGRATYGFMFSNGTSYTQRVLLDFIIKHKYETSLAIDEKDDIRNYIRVPDLPLLIWAMACATWPQGFKYQRACVADPEKCRHVVEEKLNLVKLLWTDTTSLTERQLTHMAKRQRGSVKPEDVKRYVDEFVRGQDRKIDITPELSMILRIPTVVDHIDAGYAWINTLEEIYSRALGQDESARDDYLIEQGRASAMRQYSHFVGSIQVNGDDFTERQTIDDALSDLTSQDEVREAFMGKVKDFLDQSVMSLVAIPTYTCPSCGGEQHGDHRPGFQSLIALDPSQTFFQLLVQRLRKISAR